MSRNKERVKARNKERWKTDAAYRKRRRAYHTAWRKQNKQHVLDYYRAYAPKWRDKNRKNLKLKRRADHLQRQYGMSEVDYQARLAAQGGVCAICKTTKPGGTHRVFMVDHDHKTGAIRGLLCAACNRGLGFFKDDPNYLAAAVVYLKEQV
jgi:hypothetical protein